MRFLFKAFILSFFLSGTLFSSGVTQTPDPAERFSSYDATSKTRIDHKPLTEALEVAVLPLGRSLKILGNAKATTYRNSKIRTSANLSPSRYEGNRVFFHAFSEGLKNFFRVYQEGLETLSERRAIGTFKRDEQLAYWLNLHNVILINKLSEEYPIRDLEELRLGGKKQRSFWLEKTTRVEGVPLSLADIEKIIIENWDEEIVVYGLWQGSIGGPNLPRKAYTGENVWPLLRKNAADFVNSNRGARPRGDKLIVSEFYQWILPAFDNSEEALLRHIKGWSDGNFHGDISNINTLEYDYYDWIISDLMGGVLHTGQYNQLGGVLNAKSKGHGTQESGAQFVGFQAFYNFVIGHNPLGPQEVIPPIMQDLFQGVVMNNDYQGVVTEITSEECPPGEECKADPNNRM